jgi:hypothetical protein
MFSSASANGTSESGGLYHGKEAKQIVPPVIHLGHDAGEDSQEDGKARKAEEDGEDCREVMVGADRNIAELIGDSLRRQGFADGTGGGDAGGGCGLPEIVGAETGGVGCVATRPSDEDIETGDLNIFWVSLESSTGVESLPSTYGAVGQDGDGFGDGLLGSGSTGESGNTQTQGA